MDFLEKQMVRWCRSRQADFLAPIAARRPLKFAGMTAPLWTKSPYFYPAAIYGFIATSGFGASVSDAGLGAIAFLIYFTTQLTLFGIAWFLGRNSGMLLGSILGICITSVMHALCENLWYVGSISMPYAAYVFYACPAMVVGMLVSEILSRFPFAESYWRSASITLFLLLPSTALFILESR